MSSARYRSSARAVERALWRECRSELYRRLAHEWHGTRKSLKEALAKFLKPLRSRWAALRRVARDQKFAAILAAVFVAGGAAPPALAIELSDVAAGTGGFVINGADDHHYSGGSVADAGDVNGDGLADLIVGAVGADHGGDAYAGASYVVFGKVGGTPITLADVAAGTGGFVINGIDPNDLSGYSVSGAGDVNGDGIPDLIIGAHAADPGGDSYAGESYVVFGKANETPVELSDVAAGTGGFIINGIDPYDFSGYSVSAAGDVNGDGLADVIVGAWKADPGGDSYAGESYVVFGKSNGTPVALSAVAAGTGGFVITGIDPNDESGRRVSGAGDVNGDGLDDVIVAARRASLGVPVYDHGESYVVLGKADGTPVALSNVAAGTGGFVIRGTDAGDAAGYGVSAAGDVNGDGLADLIVGANGGDPGGDFQAGESYVVFGKADVNPVTLSGVAAGTGGFVVNGIDGSDSSGHSVSTAGDVNGDGLADLLIGAPDADPGGDNTAGESYVVFGKADGTAVELSNVATGAGGFILNGIDVNDLSGRKVSDASDVNGDGLADVIVGASSADPGGEISAGESYVIFSPEVPAASGTYLMTTLAGDGAGAFVASVADFGDVARVKVDFSDDDNASGGGLNGASTETVTITRSGAGISNLSHAADVVWEITSDRAGFDSAEVTLKYLDSEIAGIPGGEAALRIFAAPALTGPWVELATERAPDRNELSATVTGFSFFAIARGTGLFLPIELADVAAGTGGFVINGINPDDQSGQSVSSAGDVNGDGIADVIVGAVMADPGGDSQAGESYVVFGKADGTAVELSDVAAGTGGFAINGADANDFSGFCVSDAGDVNGDGLADLIIGAHGSDPGGDSLAGESYVVFGKDDGIAVELSAVAAGTGGFVINGPDPGDRSGFSVSGAGDVDGDGLDDLIVGVYRADAGSDQYAGQSYVVFGKADGAAVELSGVASGTGGFVINGIDFADYSGRSVSSAGDVNGDGRSDLIVGAAQADPGGDSGAGESYVVFGKSDGMPVELSDVASGTGGFVLNGIALDDESGYSVSAAGDVNGDGLADLVIGARRADPGGDSYAGEAYVVFGKTDGTPVELSAAAAGTGGFVINGIDVNDFFGFGVSSAGDVNGDGLADLIAGAPYADGGGDPNAGESYVIFGKADGAPVELSEIAAGAGGFIINGTDLGDTSGRRVSGAGDINGDGLADLIVGGNLADPAGDSEAGESYVVFSPQVPVVPGTYLMRTLAGDGPGGSVAPGTDFGDVARVKLDFSDDDNASGPGLNGASNETVTITRSGAGIVNLADHADVVWEIETDRSGFDSAEVTLKYLDSEIAGMPGGELNLSIFKAPTLSGPWTKLDSTVDPARNEISAAVTGFSFFTISSSGPLSSSEWEKYE